MSGGMLQAAGPAAQGIAAISWAMFAGGGLVFAGVMLLLAWALRRKGSPVRPLVWLAGGGVLFPGVVLAALFAWSSPLTPAWKPVPPAGALVISVTGHMWWWELRYRDPSTGGEAVTANELRIPTGRPAPAPRSCGSRRCWPAPGTPAGRWGCAVRWR